MIAEAIPALADLDSSQKLLLVSELWKAVMAGHVDIPVSEAPLKELNECLEEFRRYPSQGTSWAQAEARIRRDEKRRNRDNADANQ